MIEYKHHIITAIHKFAEDIIKENFSSGVMASKVGVIRPHIYSTLRQLDKSGDQNLKNLALSIQKIIDAAKEDGLL